MEKNHLKHLSKSTESIRNSNIEFLRIIAMLMIVASHYSFHGFDFSQIDNSMNYLFLKVITLGNGGVDIFVLIFGYFSVSRDKVDARKVFLLWSQVFTYSVLIFVALLCFGITDFSLKALVSSGFPTVFSKYWFFTTYIVFLLVTPYINIMLKNLKQKEYHLFLGIMLVCWCIIPTFFYQFPASNDFTLFLMLYSVGAYFKLFPENHVNNKKYGTYMTVISAFLLIGSSAIFFILKQLHPIFNGKENFFYHKNSLLIVMFALGMLIVAVNSKPRYSKIINYISSCVFGIYLFHDNDLLSKILWSDVFHTSSMQNSKFLVLHCIITVFTVFVIGTVIELIRKNTIEKVWLHFFKVLSKKI